MLKGVRPIAIAAIDSSGPPEGAGLRALFESILEWGILQPLIVRPATEGRYEVLVGRKRFAAARSAGFTSVPCAVFEGSDADAAALAAASNAAAPAGPPPAAVIGPAPEGTAAALRELHAIRDTIDRALALEREHADGLRQRVARELLAMELQRGAWMIDALLAFHTAPQAGAPAAVAVGPLVRASVASFRPECRLGGIDVRVAVEPADLRVAAGEPALRTALNCMLGAVLASMHGSQPSEPVLVIHARAAAGSAVLSLSQNVVPLQALVRLRSGARGADAGAGESPVAGFAFEAARRTVEALGGRVELRKGTDDAGGAVDLKLPVAGAPDVNETQPAGGA